MKRPLVAGSQKTARNPPIHLSSGGGGCTSQNAGGPWADVISALQNALKAFSETQRLGTLWDALCRGLAVCRGLPGNQCVNPQAGCGYSSSTAADQLPCALLCVTHSNSPALPGWGTLSWRPLCHLAYGLGNYCLPNPPRIDSFFKKKLHASLRQRCAPGVSHLAHTLSLSPLRTPPRGARRGPGPAGASISTPREMRCLIRCSS